MSDEIDITPQPIPTARYMPQGVAAIDPRALGTDFPTGAARANEMAGSVAIVHISGPLTHEPSGFDTYAAIGARFDEALASEPGVILLSVNSPGGDVAGSFDLARSMRRKAAAAGVALVAHTASSCCSAGYALACSASRIACSDTAMLGSIGVIVQPVDVTAADAAMGIRYEVIASGDRKADGNPHAVLTGAARDALEQTVAAMANVFFAHVGDTRPFLSGESAKALQAGVRIGHQAVEAGLADDVCSLDELLEELGADGSDESDDDSDDNDHDFAEPDEDASSDLPGLPQLGSKMSSNQRVPLDLQTKFQSLTAAGISPDLAREECARSAEAAAAAFRGQIVSAPVARKPAPAAPVAAPKPVSPQFAAIGARTAQLAARYHAHVAAGNSSDSFEPSVIPWPESARAILGDKYVAQSQQLAAVAASQQPQVAGLRADSHLDAIFGLAPQAHTVTMSADGTQQFFGLPPAAAATSREVASRREFLDAAFHDGKAATGVRMVGNAQQFGVTGGNAQ